jgi:hypothetical protein
MLGRLARTRRLIWMHVIGSKKDQEKTTWINFPQANMV